MVKSKSKYPKWRKWFFGAGDSAGSIAHTIVAFFFLFYLTDTIGLRPALAGSVLMIGKIWDAISDPLLGHFSDNTRSRYGRRRIYLLVFALPLGISFFFLWALPTGLSTGLTFIIATFAYILHTTFLTAVMVPYQALLPEMVDEYDERTSFTAYRMFFSIIWGLFAVAIPDLIVNSSETKATGYLIMGAVFALFITVAPLFPFFGCYEKKTHFEKTKFLGFRQYLKPILMNVPFRYATLIYFFTWAGMALVETMFLYFFTYWIGKENLFYVVVAILFITAAVFLPLWVRLSEKLEKKTCYIIGMSSLALGLVLTLFINATTPTWMIYLFVVYLAFGVSAAHVLPHSLIPDCIDYGKYVNNSHNEGVYYGLITFFHKMGVAVVIWLSGIFLDLTGYVNPNGASVVQPPSAVLSIRLMQGPLPALFLVIGILIALMYPITRNNHKALIRRIEKRNEG
ncbi:MAG: MFS transporter [Clostridia bacterium]|nr:MFS transporter [Clostridia bacterium]